MPSSIDASAARPTNSSSASKKVKLAYAHMPYGPSQPASVQRRNARERNRVKQVNNGFANLRQHIPSDVVTTLSSGGRGASKKLSKVDTLRIAVEYIRRLQDLLDDDTDASSMASSSSSRLSQNSTGSYYSTTSSPMQCTSIPPPPCSETSASPTPSYSSENSSIGGHGTYPTQHTFKFETYDPCYNHPDDVEILKYIEEWEQWDAKWIYAYDDWYVMRALQHGNSAVLFFSFAQGKFDFITIILCILLMSENIWKIARKLIRVTLLLSQKWKKKLKKNPFNRNERRWHLLFCATESDRIKNDGKKPFHSPSVYVRLVSLRCLMHREEKDV